jgi:hypothetical protein
MTDTRSETKFRQQFPTGCPPTLNVVAWPDTNIDAHGHRPGSPYIEATRSKWIFELSEYWLLGGGSGG